VWKAILESLSFILYSSSLGVFPVIDVASDVAKREFCAACIFYRRAKIIAAGRVPPDVKTGCSLRGLFFAAGGTLPTAWQYNVRNAYDTARYLVHGAHAAVGKEGESKVKSKQQILRFAQDGGDGSV
jgi:hypothetical protein